jgi:hypothetical protein
MVSICQLVVKLQCMGRAWDTQSSPAALLMQAEPIRQSPQHTLPASIVALPPPLLPPQGQRAVTRLAPSQSGWHHLLCHCRLMAAPAASRAPGQSGQGQQGHPPSSRPPRPAGSRPRHVPRRAHSSHPHHSAQGAAAALHTRPLPQPTASSLVVESFSFFHRPGQGSSRLAGALPGA